MERPEIFLIPALMLADYYLTLAGARLSVPYRQHFRSEEYELNPVWQKSIREAVGFNPRHLASVVLVTVLLFYVQYPPSGLGFAFDSVFGMLLGAYATVLGRHLSNLALFRYVNTHPDALSGEVHMTREILLVMSRWQYLALAVPVILLALLTSNQMVSGAAAGIVVLALVQVFWSALGKRKQPGVA